MASPPRIAGFECSGDSGMSLLNLHLASLVNPCFLPHHSKTKTFRVIRSYWTGLMNKMRFLMIGGFLGAGKTTTLSRLAGHFMQRGLQVGIVTNDQAADLVDTH